MRSRSEKKRVEESSSIDSFLEHSRFPEHPRLIGDLERIITKVVKVDVEKEYDRLLDALTLETSHISERGLIKVALNHAEKNWWSARNIQCIASQNKAEWEIRQTVVIAAMWEAATLSLQSEKEDGNRSKAITNGDVEFRANSMFPDEWRFAKSREKSIELLIERLKQLADCWKSRCMTLRSMFDSSR